MNYFCTEENIRKPLPEEDPHSSSIDGMLTTPYLQFSKLQK